MVDSQEIIERSFYSALLETTLNMGLTLDPSQYFSDKVSVDKYERDKKEILRNEGQFIEVFGASNNQSKGSKNMGNTSRIVVIPQGFIPGNVGLNKNHLEKVNQNWVVSETPFEAIDQLMEVRLVATNIQTLRILYKIMYAALPQRGYLKPYVFDKHPFDGNIFIVASNFYDDSSDSNGLLEKVYVWEVHDTLLDIPRKNGILEPIKEINVDILGQGNTQDKLHVKL